MNMARSADITLLRTRKSRKEPGEVAREPTANPTVEQSHKPTEFKLLLTPREAARALSIDRSTLYVLLMRGDITSITIGRARRIPVKALEEWIAEQIAA
jgi:excisionase family DNA binding protein